MKRPCYYSVSTARREEDWAKEHERLRKELGIVARKEQNELMQGLDEFVDKRTPLFTDEELKKMTITDAEEGKQS